MTSWMAKFWFQEWQLEKENLLKEIPKIFIWQKNLLEKNYHLYKKKSIFQNDKDDFLPQNSFATAKLLTIFVVSTMLQHHHHTAIKPGIRYVSHFVPNSSIVQMTSRWGGRGPAAP